MSKLKSSISGFLTVVAFLVLTALAAVWYGGENEQQAKLDQNNFYQKARITINTVLLSSQKLADINLTKNFGLGQKIQNELAATKLGKATMDNSDVKLDSWVDFKAYFLEEWQRDETSVREENKEFISWERDDNNSVIIITLRNGQQYKIPILKR